MSKREPRRKLWNSGVSVPISLCPDRVFINVLFLSIVNPHKRFDRFDDALSIPDEIAIDFSGSEAFGEPSKESRQVDDLAMGSAHGA